MRKWISIIILLFIGSQSVQATDEIDLLRQRLVENALEKAGFQQTVDVNLDKSVEYQNTLRPDGSWADVDYLDKNNDWSPYKHLDRMLALTYAYSKDTCTLYGDDGAIQALERSIAYWYKINPRCKNWYKNDIGKQYRMNVIALLLDGKIDSLLHRKLVRDLTSEVSMTGTNKINLSISVFYRGVIEEDSTRIKAAVEGVQSTVFMSKNEGIQPDFSFHQHGPMLYNGDYGFRFFAETVRFAAIVAGTKYAFSHTQMELLSNFFIEGLRWNLRGKLFDYNVRGREVGADRGRNLKAMSLIPVLDELIVADPDHASIYERSKNAILSGKPQDIEGVRHYWCSDYSVFHSKKYFTSLKMCSKRTLGIERNINTENLMGYWLPYGFTYIYRRGDEYHTIFPVWDWARLPGVTNPYREVSWQDNKQTYTTQKTSFVGGVTDGMGGVSVMDFDYSDTQAKKAWFWFGDEFLALGCEITSSHDSAVVTGVNQVLKSGDVWVNNRKFSGLMKATDITEAWHDSVGYFFPDGQLLTVKSGEQTGSWNRILGLENAERIREDVFSVWFDHGYRPDSGKYEYVVVPGISRKGFKRYVKQRAIQVLSNNENIQAAYKSAEDKLGIVLYEQGSYSLDGVLELSVNTPCILWITGIQTDHPKLTFCDPVGKASNLVSTIRMNKGKDYMVDIAFPSGNDAGSSVVIELNKFLD